MTFLLVFGLCFVAAGVVAFVASPVLKVTGAVWVGVGAVLVATARIAAASAARRKRLLETGKAGRATILQVTSTAVTINKNPRVLLRVRIEVHGESPIEASTKMLVPRVAIPRAGEVYEVRFDPQNPNDFTFAEATPRAAPSRTDDKLSQLERLAALRDRGALTQAEFDAQKRELFGKG